MKSIKYSFIFTLLFFISSCDADKYLDIYPLTSVTEGSFYVDESELQQALNDVYRHLARIYDARHIADLYGEMYSDNTQMLLSSGLGAIYQHFNQHVLLADNAPVLTAWNGCYNSIFVCNKVISEIENAQFPIAENTKNSMIGEALLVRALIYFNMVRAWGDIPLITKVISPAESYDYLRESKAKVYEQIITDLTFARTHLPESWTGSNVGRVTRYAAAGILAKVYLTLDNKPSAITELQFIINSGRYSLDANNDGTVNADDYFHLFTPGVKNCKESILEVQYLAGANAVNSLHQRIYAPWDFTFNLIDLGVPASNFHGEGMNTPTDDLQEEYEENDPRNEASIYQGYTNPATNEFVTYPFTIKYFDPNWANPGQRLYVVRYADVLLMYSEAANDPAYLNMVRARAGLPLFGSPEYPGDLYPTLERAIEHERRVELAFEFHRFFDLVRTGRALDIMQAKGYDNLNANRLLFPIPQHARDVNPDLTQNPGYGD